MALFLVSFVHPYVEDCGVGNLPHIICAIQIVSRTSLSEVPLCITLAPALEPYTESCQKMRFREKSA